MFYLALFFYGDWVYSQTFNKSERALQSIQCLETSFFKMGSLNRNNHLGHLFDKGIIRDIQTFFADLLNFLLDYSCESRLIYFRNPIAYNYPGAEGWIYSIGIKGIQSINGTMRGTLFDRTDIDDLGFSIIGFKGLKICMNYPFDAFYIGHALALKIEHKNPKEV